MTQRWRLADWSKEHGAPSLEAPPEGEDVLVVAAFDPDFGQQYSRWLEFGGALCDDGGVRVSEYSFHARVEIGAAELRLVRTRTRSTDDRLFEGTVEHTEWGFYRGPAQAVAALATQK